MLICSYQIISIFGNPKIITIKQTLTKVGKTMKKYNNKIKSQMLPKDNNIISDPEWLNRVVIHEYTKDIYQGETKPALNKNCKTWPRYHKYCYSMPIFGFAHDYVMGHLSMMLYAYEELHGESISPFIDMVLYPFETESGTEYFFNSDDKEYKWEFGKDEVIITEFENQEIKEKLSKFALYEYEQLTDQLNTTNKNPFINIKGRK